MAISGPAPKEQRRRRNADAFTPDKTVLPTEEVLAELKTIPEGEWHPEVQLWWRVWSNSTQSSTFTGTDWMRMRELMVTLQSYYLRPTPQKMAEIRQTEGLWGATHTDRLKARMKIDRPDIEPEKPQLSAVASLKERLKAEAEKKAG